MEDNPDAGYIELIPPNLKSDIGSFFVLARSIDATVKIPNTRSLVSSLQTAMVLCNNTKYDALIERCKQSCVLAIAAYLDNNWAYGAELCDTVLDDIGFLVYSGYGKMEINSFSLPTQRGDKK